MTYSRNGDYWIPDVEMDKQPEGTMGKYGRLRKRFLQEHRKGLYNELLLTGELTKHLMEIDRAAKAQMEQLMKEMAKAEGVTEELKATDQMGWVGRMNNIQSSAEEIILNELIYN